MKNTVKQGQRPSLYKAWKSASSWREVKKILSLFFIISALVACDDDEKSKVYILNSATLVSESFVITDEPLELNFKLALTTGYPLPEYSGFTKDINVYLKADNDKVETYNAANDASYEILPEVSYTFNREAVIMAGNVYSENITLSVMSKGNINPFVHYMLPISIESVSGAEADNVLQTVYFSIYGTPDVSNMSFLDRSLWSIVDFSSEELTGEGANNGNAKHAIDGYNSRFWHTQWQGQELLPPHYITIDMGKEETVSGFSYTTRNIGSGWPKDITIYVSNNGTDWEEAISFTGTAARATEVRQAFPSTFRVRYFKMYISSVYSATSTHVAEINVL